MLSIELRHIDNMKKFVFDLYGCDTVPIEHLHAKLRYLFDVPPLCMIVLVKNSMPEEVLVGEGAFRKVQCQRINRIKWNIREKFNPRINGVRSEHHVVHASDYEQQVDYLLRLLGYPEGIRRIDDSNDGLPFRKPFHIPKPTTFVFRRSGIDYLRASILCRDSKERIYAHDTPIQNTPHFRALVEDAGLYLKYLQEFRFTYLKDDYSWHRFYELSRLPTDAIRQLDPVLVTAEDGYFRILDGVHRAAIALYHQLDSIRCVELNP